MVRAFKQAVVHEEMRLRELLWQHSWATLHLSNELDDFRILPPLFNINVAQERGEERFIM